VSKGWRWIILMTAVAVTSAVAAVAWMHLSKPTILKVAVGPPGFADAELMAAFGPWQADRGEGGTRRDAG